MPPQPFFPDHGSEKIAEITDEHLFRFPYTLTESEDLARAYMPFVLHFLDLAELFVSIAG